MTTTSDYYDDNEPSGIGFLGVLFFLFISALVFLGVIGAPLALQDLQANDPIAENAETIPVPTVQVAAEVLQPLPLVTDLPVLESAPVQQQAIQIANAIKVPAVIPHIHADEEHGVEAQEIRDCLKNNGGATQIWRTVDKSTYYLFCQLSDGRWGFQAINKNLNDGSWHEKTAFVKADGSWAKLIRYMEKIATRFNGPYPWE